MFRSLCGPAFRLLLRMRVENAPASPGAYVLVANHCSLLDPLLLGAASPRHVFFLMTSVHWRSRWLGWFYRWMRAIPLFARGGNRDALRAAREVLARGDVLGVFPEGGISRDGGLMLGSPGAVALVLGGDVPIVPVGLIGAYEMLPFERRWPRRVGVTVRFGRPIPASELAPPDVGRKERLAHATRRIMREIAALTGQTAREDLLGAAPPQPTRESRR